MQCKGFSQMNKYLGLDFFNFSIPVCNGHPAALPWPCALLFVCDTRKTWQMLTWFPAELWLLLVWLLRCCALRRRNNKTELERRDECREREKRGKNITHWQVLTTIDRGFYLAKPMKSSWLVLMYESWMSINSRTCNNTKHLTWSGSFLKVNSS